MLARLLELSLTSPAGDLMRKHYSNRQREVYLDELFFRDVFLLQLLLLEVLVILDGVVDHAYGDAVIHALLINDQSQVVLRHLEPTCQN